MLIYAYILLILCSLCVGGGVKYVSAISPFFLLPVLLSVLSIWVGIFLAGARQFEACIEDPICLRPRSDTGNCSVVEGLSGLSAQNIEDNYGPAGPDDSNEGEYDFRFCLALFFPSVTGIMAGSNRSGDLKDAQRSIPIGTICATLSTSALYLLTSFMYGAVADRDTILDESFILAAKVSWPHPVVVQVGIVLSTLGAALQSLTGAPRLLQAIANDNLIPVLSVFRGKGEPRRALALSFVICAGCIAFGDLNVVAPIITMFFLLCYMFVNLACLLQDLLKEPNWRPRFRFYHPVTALLGLGLCLFIMFFTDPAFAGGAIVVVIMLYAYITYRKVEAQWGDGMRGLRYQRARTALEALEKLKDGPHIKNWRPQVLLLCKMSPSDRSVTQPKMIELLSQLKGGRGLCILGSIVPGQLAENAAEQAACETKLRQQRDAAKLRGFTQVIMCADVDHGLAALLQTAGLGALAPNTVMAAWPRHWQDDPAKALRTVMLVQRVVAYNMALIVVKGSESLPESHAQVKNSIDIYWVLHDGGLQLLLTTILRKSRVWSHAALRVFCVLQQNEDPDELQMMVEQFLYQMRIIAEVKCVILGDNSGRDRSKPAAAATDWKLNKSIVNKPIGALLGGTAVSEDLVEEQRGNGSRTHSRGASRSNSFGLQRKGSGPDGEKAGVRKRHSIFVKSSLLADIASGLERDKGSSSKLFGAERAEAEQVLLSTRVLNRLIAKYSNTSAMVMTNMPMPELHKNHVPELFMEQVDALTANLPLCLLVIGQRNADVVTMYS